MESHRGSGFAGGDLVNLRSGNLKINVNEKRGFGSIDEATLIQFQSGTEPPNKRAKLTKEVFQIPVVESQHIYRQHCKSLHTVEGCPYGENCSVLREMHSRDRESVSTCLVSNHGGSYGGRRTSNPAQLHPRTCNMWEREGRFSYGSKCIFPHGAAEPQPNGGGLVNTHANGPAKASVGSVGAPSGRSPYVVQKPGEVPVRVWKGPNKISKIYGDWIDDL